MGAMQSAVLPFDFDSYTVITFDQLPEKIQEFYRKKQYTPRQHRQRDVNGVIDLYVETLADWWHHWQKPPGGEFHLQSA